MPLIFIVAATLVNQNRKFKQYNQTPRVSRLVMLSIYFRSLPILLGWVAKKGERKGEKGEWAADRNSAGKRGREREQRREPGKQAKAEKHCKSAREQKNQTT